ncbi:MAG: alpha/beta hydrolase, partial [Chloroflexi bacterium]|nr:alpha/beta hydrolase [Chloroflexota bacterium]
ALKERNIPYENVKLQTADGLVLAAWYTPPQNGSLILVAHGFGGFRPDHIHAMLARNGYGVLSWDFRAHGESGGETCSLGFYEQLDAEAALRYALSQPGVERVGAWGGSMGAATMILAAAEHREIEAVVSDSAFPSLEDVVRLNTPIRIMQPFVLFFAERQGGFDLKRVSPVDRIADISPRAVFIIDGWDGAAVAMNSPYRLFEAAREPKQLWVEEGVPHLATYSLAPLEYEKRVVAFFERYLK